ncbi:type I glyceraldehyde-3-phosphate dehydrogenase [Candidatus Gracilibacteria bacterium]|nr:type I glyceraldehyde-3-phosphate dehydrogenase [Candidatus Gracilibacteria bacterium]
MAKKRIAINGFGRIGRAAARLILSGHTNNIELVAINDPSPTEISAYLFEFDSNFGRYNGSVQIEDGGDTLNIDGVKIRKFTTREISELPWGELNIDVVIDCTGAFRTQEKAAPHIAQGAKKVLLSAPAKDDNFKTVVIGVNDDTLTGEEQFVSNASCTTNGLAPIAKVLNENFGIESGLMTTIHSYTSSQPVLDLGGKGGKDFRRMRSAGVSILPTSTGAAKAVGLVLPELKGKLDGLAIRVPTPTVSLIDLTLKLQKQATAEEINKAIEKASTALPHIIGYEPRPLVSIDYKCDSHSTIFDPTETRVLGDMVKVLSWYDNEWGYSCRLVELAEKL